MAEAGRGGALPRRTRKFWDLAQDARIRAGAARTEAAVGQAAGAAAHAQALESTLDRLLLINRALWEIVRDRLGLDEAAIADKVTEIDLRDGQKDGRLRKVARECSGCGRVLNRRHRHCLYCGAEDGAADVFDSAR